MKRIIGLLSLGLVVFGNLSAYDYQTVYSNRTAFFTAFSGEVKTMKIDSVKFNGDSILYPLKNIQMLDYSCYTPYGASWLGSKIIIKQGWNYFFNRNNDTIRIKTDAKLNEQWTVYTDSNIVMAVFGTVQKIEAVNYLGLTDTIKTIVFNAVIATSGLPEKVKSIIPADFDGQTIQISKNYGLIKTFNMLVFPYQNENTTSFMGSWTQYILSGLTNPTVGVQNLKWFDVFDFQVGDEIHTLYESTPPMGFPPPAGYIYKTEEIKRYLSKDTYSDSLVYNVEIKQQRYTANSTSYVNYIQRDVIKQNEGFNVLPDVPIIGYGNANKYKMFIGENIAKCDPNIYEEIIQSNESCWHVILADGCFTNNTYIKSLGGPYYSCTGFSGDSEDRSLVYYKKGNTTWGVPYLHLAVAPVNQHPEITLTPNPASDIIRLTNLPEYSNLSIELFDLKGSKLLQSTVSQTENALDISVLDKGLYIYRINSGNGLLQTGKIVKN